MTHTVQAIALTLIHFCWQAAAIAVIYRGLSLLATRCASNTRYLLALGSLLLMIAASIGTFAFEMQSESTIPADNAGPSPFHDYHVSLAPFGSAPAAATGAAASLAPAPRTLQLPAMPLPFLRALVGVWMLGVVVLALRSLGGWWLLQRLRATAIVEAPPAVRASFVRIARALGLRRKVLLRVSSAITGPVTVGALRALVLLPLSAATSLSPEQLEVVLAHELAHVRRADFFWNLVQTFAETLYFFHPAVWWIGSRIRHERELCCDDLALTVCPDPVVYASALYQLEKQRRPLVQFAMALDGHQPNSLRMRIARILGEPSTASSVRGPVSLAAAAAVLVVLLIPAPHVLASLKTAAENAHPASTSSMQATASAPVVVSVNAHAAVTDRTAVDTSVVADVVTPQAQPAPAPAAPSITAPSPQPAPASAAPEPEQDATDNSHEKGDYIDRMKAAGYDVDLDKFIAMKVQNITPDYARRMAQLGFGKLTADELIAAKVQGVTPDYITSLKQGGIDVKSIEDAISYRIFSVTPEYIAQMKSAGFGDLSSQRLLALRVQGVTPEYARSIKQQYPAATADDVVKTRIFNIDAAFIASAKRHGLTDLSLDKLVQLRISGILEDESK
jgi:beta-lactamase regulating signal transducer with metallopeptidase domain